MISRLTRLWLFGKLGPATDRVSNRLLRRDKARPPRRALLFLGSAVSAVLLTQFAYRDRLNEKPGTNKVMVAAAIRTLIPPSASIHDPISLSANLRVLSLPGWQLRRSTPAPSK